MKKNLVYRETSLRDLRMVDLLKDLSAKRYRRLGVASSPVSSTFKSADPSMTVRNRDYMPKSTLHV